MKIDVIDPANDPAWEAFIQETPEATPFHTGAWAKVLRDTYDFQPRYMVTRHEDGTLSAGIPLFEVSNSRLVGVPFSDYCPPLLPDSEDSRALVQELKRTTSNGTSALELRGTSTLDLEAEGFAKADAFVQHVISLDGDMKELEARFRKNMRQAIRKAKENGLTVRAGDSLSDMERFYELNILTRRKHGLIPQPWRFFENIHRYMISTGCGVLLLCEYEGRIIAGDMMLAYGKKLVGKFNASDRRYQALGPNHLLQVRGIELGVADGYNEINLGRTELEHDGLRRFKKGWGSREEPLPYYYYPADQTGSWSTGQTPPGGQQLMALFVRFAPSWALRMAGAAIYRRAA